MKPWKKAAVALVSLAVLGICFAAFVLPVIVRGQAIQRLQAATGRAVTIGKVSINPLTLTAEVKRFQIAEKTGAVPFVSFSSVRVSISPRSIFKAAPIVSNARIVSPYLHLVRTGANTYNFSDILERQHDTKKSSSPLRFSLNNIVIQKGAIDFLDQGLPRQKQHTARDIEISIPFISNIPYLAEAYINPSFSAVINGAPLHVEGKLKPFARAVEASVNVDLKDVDLPFHVAYIPGPLPVGVDSGSLTVNAGITYRIASAGNPDLEVRGTINLAKLSMRDSAGGPLLSLDQGAVAIDRAEILDRQFALTSLTLSGLKAHISRDSRGGWSYERLLRKEPTPPQNLPRQEPQSQKTLVTIGNARIMGGEVHFADAAPPGGFRTQVRDIDLDLNGFSTEAGKKATYELSFLTDREEEGLFTGEFTATPFTTVTTAELDGIGLQAYYPYLANFITAPLEGKVAAAADIMITPQTGVKIDKAAITLRKLAARFGENEWTKLPLVELKGGMVDLKAKSAEIDSVLFRGGDIRFSRDMEGRFSPIALLRQDAKSGSVAGKPGEREGSPPFRLRVKNVSGSGLAISFTDRTKEEAPELAVSKLNFAIAGLTRPKPSPMPVRISAVYGRDGEVKFTGTIMPAPFAAKGECSLRRIPLTDFEAYLPEGVNLVLADGLLDARASFNIAERNKRLTGDYHGEVGVRNFYCLDDVDSEDLLKWESLQLEEIHGKLDPFTVDIGEVSLARFFAKVVVNKNGTLNIQKLYTPPPKQPAAAADAVQAPTGASSQRKQVRIGAVTLQDGILAFTDHHMKPEYATIMYNLGGRVSGLSSEESKVADVDLRGNLENQSPLRITGQINPLRDDLFLNLKVSFSDIELSPITPYSGTFLGYAVDKGKLFLDLSYLVEKKKLQSENKVFIDQFTFGNKVESERATGLPVRLAVALLKDRKGEIHLDLPVTGQIDDPKFSVFSVVLEMLKNLLVKAATSPLALLQGLAAGKDDFSTIGFAPGIARLADAEREKLRKLAQLLHDRPALKLEVSGFVDRERDAEGYREELLSKKIRQERFLDLLKEKKDLSGQTPETVVVSPEHHAKYLRVVYKKEKFPKPRNMLGLVKDLPDAEMKKLILANTVVGEEQFQALARERATAVRTELVMAGKLSQERIFEKKGDIHKLPEKKGEVAGRVEFGVAVQ